MIRKPMNQNDFDSNVKELREALEKRCNKKEMELFDKYSQLGAELDDDLLKEKDCYFSLVEKLHDYAVNLINKGYLYMYIMTPVDSFIFSVLGDESLILQAEDNGKRRALVGSISNSLEGINLDIEAQKNAINKIKVRVKKGNIDIKQRIQLIEKNMEGMDEDFKSDISDQFSTLKNLSADEILDINRYSFTIVKITSNGLIEPVSDISQKAHKDAYDLICKMYNLENRIMIENTEMYNNLEMVKKMLLKLLNQVFRGKEAEEYVSLNLRKNLLTNILNSDENISNSLNGNLVRRKSWTKDDLTIVFTHLKGMDVNIYKLIEMSQEDVDIENIESSDEKLSKETVHKIMKNALDKKASLNAVRRSCDFANYFDLFHDDINLIKDISVIINSGAINYVNTILNIIEWQVSQLKASISSLITSNEDLKESNMGKGLLDFLNKMEDEVRN